MAVVGPLVGLDPEALRLIKEVAQWKWHPGVYGFVSDFGRADAGRLPRAELVEHHLFGEVAASEREAGIAWLKQKLGLG